MSHFAEIDQAGTVLRVIVADQAFINSGAVGDPAHWVQTSYTGSIRGRFAGVGYSFDADRDAFIPPRPFASWVLDEATLDWVAPIERPDAGVWHWDETSLSWLPS